MKKSLIVFLMAFLLFVSNNAYAVEGAAPPEEGMIGITSVQEDDPNAPVSNETQGSDVINGDSSEIYETRGPAEPAPNERTPEIAEETYVLKADQKTTASQESASNYYTYGVIGMLLVAGILAFTKFTTK